MNEPEGRLQSGGGKTLGSSSTKSSTLSQKGKSNELGLNTAEAQKKLGKFFKGLGPSKASSLPPTPRLILFDWTRDMRFVWSLLYLTLVGYVRILLISVCHDRCGLVLYYGCSSSHLATLSTRSLFLPLILLPLDLKNAWRKLGHPVHESGETEYSLPWVAQQQATQPWLRRNHYQKLLCSP